MPSPFAPHWTLDPAVAILSRTRPQAADHDLEDVARLAARIPDIIDAP